MQDHHIVRPFYDEFKYKMLAYNSRNLVNFYDYRKYEKFVIDRFKLIKKYYGLNLVGIDHTDFIQISFDGLNDLSYNSEIVMNRILRKFFLDERNKFVVVDPIPLQIYYPAPKLAWFKYTEEENEHS